MDYEQIVFQMSEWAKHKYSTGLEAIPNPDPAIKQKTKEVLFGLRRYYSYMNGYSIENLHRDDRAEISKDVLFSYEFHRMAESNYISPAFFAYRIVEKSCRNGAFPPHTQGLVSRGLRIFPSFLRELCLAYKIKYYLPDAITKSDVNNDVNKHTDILLSINGSDYRIWSYQSNSLYNTKRKIKGYRGELPNGIFVLCPFDRTNSKCYENINGWDMYSDIYVKKVVDTIVKTDIASSDNYKDKIINATDDDLTRYLREIHIFRK